MPFEYILDSHSHLAVVHPVNPISIPSFLDFVRQFRTDNEVNGTTNILIDTSFVDPPSLDEASEVADVLSSETVFKNRRIAIFATEKINYDISRRIAILANIKGANLKVFAKLNKAIDWLELA